MNRIYSWIKIICIPTIGILMPLLFYTGNDRVEFFAWFAFSLLVTFLSWEAGSKASSIISRSYPIDQHPLKHLAAMVVFFVFLTAIVVFSIFLVNRLFGSTGPGYWSEMKGIHLIVLLCTFMITSIHEGIYLFFNWKSSLKELRSIREGEAVNRDLSAPDPETPASGSPEGYYTRTGESSKRGDGEKTREGIPDSYKKHFTVQVGSKIKIVREEDIAYFYAMEKGVYIKTFSNRDYDIDYTLGQLVNLTDPERFFRINRKFIVNIHSIAELVTLSKSRMKVVLTPAPLDEIILGHARSMELKSWLNR